MIKEQIKLKVQSKHEDLILYFIWQMCYFVNPTTTLESKKCVIVWQIHRSSKKQLRWNMTTVSL